MQPGNEIARYVILGKLATGGMAEVWLARQRGPAGFSKTLVLKTIATHLTESSDFVSMFLEEARLAALINHPNVVQIFDLGQDNGRYFIAMEYLEGRNLSHIVKALEERGQPFPLSLAARIITDACAGLDFAHDLKDSTGRNLNLVHRDVSPENVVVTYSGQVKLLDFGIAKAAASSNLTRPGTVKGKINYIAPEQVRGAPLDRRVDIWALGVNFYVLCTGVKPFESKNEIDVLRAVLDKQPAPPSKLRANIPPPLERVILRAMAKNPQERYSTAGAMRVELEEWLQHQPGGGSYQVGQLMEELFPLSTDTVRQRLAALTSAQVAPQSTPSQVPAPPVSARPKEMTQRSPPPAPPPEALALRNGGPVTSQTAPYDDSPEPATVMAEPIEFSHGIPISVQSATPYSAPEAPNPNKTTSDRPPPGTASNFPTQSVPEVGATRTGRSVRNNGEGTRPSGLPWESAPSTGPAPLAVSLPLHNRADKIAKKRLPGITLRGWQRDALFGLAVVAAVALGISLGVFVAQALRDLLH